MNTSRNLGRLRCLLCLLIWSVPFKSRSKEKKYREAIKESFRAGVRKREPQTLDEALAELRRLRTVVQQQRKRIWFLENRDKHNSQQRTRRRGAFEQNVLATLAAMQNRGEITVHKSNP